MHTLLGGATYHMYNDGHGRQHINRCAMLFVVCGVRGCRSCAAEGGYSISQHMCIVARIIAACTRTAQISHLRPAVYAALARDCAYTLRSTTLAGIICLYPCCCGCSLRIHLCLKPRVKSSYLCLGSRLRDIAALCARSRASAHAYVLHYSAAVPPRASAHLCDKYAEWGRKSGIWRGSIWSRVNCWRTR